MKRILSYSLKAYMAGLLIILAIVGIFQQGYQRVGSQLILAVSVAIILDLILNYLKTKKAVFSSSALITGLIIGLVLAPQSSWFIVVIASTLAITQKYIIRYRGRHIFNPANFGLLSAIFIFSAYPTWWGQSFWPLIILMGLFICHRMKRLVLPIIFIITFILLFSLNNLLLRQPLWNSFLLINMFFVFIMLIEPKTAPVTKKGRKAYAAVGALLSFTFFKLVPQYDFSLLALASANALVPVFNRLKE